MLVRACDLDDAGLVHLHQCQLDLGLLLDQRSVGQVVHQFHLLLVAQTVLRLLVHLLHLEEALLVEDCLVLAGEVGGSVLEELLPEEEALNLIELGVL